jgi:hypothetical protein
MKEGLDQENLDLLSGYSDSRDGAEEGDVLFDTFRELLSFKTAPGDDYAFYFFSVMPYWLCLRVLHTHIESRFCNPHVFIFTYLNIIIIIISR